MLIAIVDDDDVLSPERFVRQFSFLAARSDLDLVFSSVRWIDDAGEVIGTLPGIVRKGKFPVAPADVFELLYLESNKIPNPTIMLRRRVFESVGGYPARPWIGEDWFWFMQMAASGIHMAPCNGPLVDMRRGSQHVSLMSVKEPAFRAQRQVITMTRTWLEKQGIMQFDHLHHRAMANQLIREARYWGRFRGLFLCQQALLLDPVNAYAHRTLKDFVTRGWRRVVRQVSSLQSRSS